jgi:hypothetical protein
VDADAQRGDEQKPLVDGLLLMAFYRRVIERGKPHNVSLVAAMRKLLQAICSVAKHRRPFVPFLNFQGSHQ